jgi:hypothetical protein
MARRTPTDVRGEPEPAPCTGVKKKTQPKARSAASHEILALRARREAGGAQPGEQDEQEAGTSAASTTVVPTSLAIHRESGPAESSARKGMAETSCNAGYVRSRQRARSDLLAAGDAEGLSRASRRPAADDLPVVEADLLDLRRIVGATGQRSMSILPWSQALAWTTKCGSVDRPAEGDSPATGAVDDQRDTKAPRGKLMAREPGAIRGRHFTDGDKKQETGNRQPATGNRQLPDTDPELAGCRCRLRLPSPVRFSALGRR